MERKDEAIVNLEILRLKGLADEANLNLLGNLHMDRNEPQLALLAYLAAMRQGPHPRRPPRAQVRPHPQRLRLSRQGRAVHRPHPRESRRPLPPPTSPPCCSPRCAVAQAKGETERKSALLNQLLELNPADGEVLLELARHKDLLSRDEADEEKRTAWSRKPAPTTNSPPATKAPPIPPTSRSARCWCASAATPKLSPISKPRSTSRKAKASSNTSAASAAPPTGWRIGRGNELLVISY
jgi:hypothetical protein